MYTRACAHTHTSRLREVTTIIIFLIFGRIDEHKLPVRSQIVKVLSESFMLIAYILLYTYDFSASYIKRSLCEL